jgi:hypothetical protein
VSTRRKEKKRKIKEKLETLGCFSSTKSILNGSTCAAMTQKFRSIREKKRTKEKKVPLSRQTEKTLSQPVTTSASSS